MELGQKEWMIVYKAENIINGKVYIGRTKNNLETRAHLHNLSAIGGSKTIFHSAIREYGIDSFVFFRS